jgi:hypothetical protein
MLMLALTRNRYAVIIFSASAGVMYSTLFTLPYLLVAHYHAAGTVSLKVATIWFGGKLQASRLDSFTDGEISCQAKIMLRKRAFSSCIFRFN